MIRNNVFCKPLETVRILSGLRRISVMGNDKIITFHAANDTSSDGDNLASSNHYSDNIILFPQVSRISNDQLIELEEKAYDWVYSIVKDKTLKRYSFSNYMGFYQMNGVHYSLFHKKNHISYFRMYGEKDDRVLYTEILGYYRLLHNCPDFTYVLVRNGIYAYLKATDPDLCKVYFRNG